MPLKYHISPSSGRPNQCTASAGRCPHGSEQDHYGSKDEARLAYEENMSENTLAPTLKKSKDSADAVKRPGRPAKMVSATTKARFKEIAGSKSKLSELTKKYPSLSFTEGSSGELLVSGPQSHVKKYVQEAGIGRVKVAEVSASVDESPTEKIPEAIQTIPEPNFKVDDWESQLAAEPKPEELESEEVSIDDDWSDIKCDGCGNAISKCSCGSCEYCGSLDGEDHYEDCPHYSFTPKAYSWD